MHFQYFTFCLLLSDLLAGGNKLFPGLPLEGTEGVFTGCLQSGVTKIVLMEFVVYYFTV